MNGDYPFGSFVANKQCLQRARVSIRLFAFTYKGQAGVGKVVYKIKRERSHRAIIIITKAVFLSFSTPLASAATAAGCFYFCINNNNKSTLMVSVSSHKAAITTTIVVNVKVFKSEANITLTTIIITLSTSSVLIITTKPHYIS